MIWQIAMAGELLDRELSHICVSKNCRETTAIRVIFTLALGASADFSTTTAAGPVDLAGVWAGAEVVRSLVSGVLDIDAREEPWTARQRVGDDGPGRAVELDPLHG